MLQYVEHQASHDVASHSRRILKGVEPVPVIQDCCDFEDVVFWFSSLGPPFIHDHLPTTIIPHQDQINRTRGVPRLAVTF
jgi:hypothetical protein